MDRRQPGYLVPGSRRIDHVYTVAMRNVVPSAALAGAVTGGPPSMFYQILADNGALLYRSELLETTCNPTWAPIEWAFVANNIQGEMLEFADPICVGDGSGAPGCCDLAKRHIMVFQLFGVPDSSLAAARSIAPTGQYFLQEQVFEEDAPEVPDALLLLERRVDLRTDLHFLGFDVFDALAQLDPSAPSMAAAAAAAAAAGLGPAGAVGGLGAAGAGSGGSRSAAAAAAAATRERTDGDFVIVDLQTGGNVAAAAYNLEAMPANMLVFALDDGHYLLRDAAMQLLGIRPPPPVAVAAGAGAMGTGGTGVGGEAGAGSVGVGPLVPPSLLVASSTGSAGGVPAGGSDAGGPGSRPMPRALASAASPVAGGSALGSGNGSVASGGGPRHDLRVAFDVTHRLMQLRVETRGANAARALKTREVAQALVAADGAAVASGSVQLLQRTAQLQKLRLLRDALAAEVAEGEWRVRCVWAALRRWWRQRCACTRAVCGIRAAVGLLTAGVSLRGQPD
jgi:hypothetical protein